VVKADAYGHGAEEVTLALSQTADCFAVAIVDEALKIRLSACGKDILIFTPPLDEAEIVTSAINGFTLTVSDLYTAKRIVETCRKYSLSVKVHLKVNTGMNRYGMNVQTLGKVCKLLRQSPYVRVLGIYSHLCECDLGRAKRQRRIFMRMLAVGKGYFPTLIAHLGASYGATLGEKFAFDMVRIGLGLYGYLPCEANAQTGVLEETVQRLHLEKGMEVYAKVVAGRKYVSGGLGYGEEARSLSIDRLFVCRVGYADGFLRQKRNGIEGWQDNANNLCMDACIRFGDIRRGAWVPILTDAEKTAKELGTIPYEVLCAATRRAELIYDDETAFC
jgi:alanine racemase